MTIEDDLPFKIERWSEGYGRPEEIIAMAADLLSAKAAFEAAVKRRPGEPIMVLANGPGRTARITRPHAPVPRLGGV